MIHYLHLVRHHPIVMENHNTRIVLHVIFRYIIVQPILGAVGNENYIQFV